MQVHTHSNPEGIYIMNVKFGNNDLFSIMVQNINKCTNKLRIL